MQCLLCRKRAEIAPYYDDKNAIAGVKVECVACGPYLLSLRAQKALQIFIADSQADTGKRALEKLSLYIKDARRGNDKPPFIACDVLENCGIRTV